MQMRKDALVEGYVYHIYTRNIQGLEVFKDTVDRRRMTLAIRFYQAARRPVGFSELVRMKNTTDDEIIIRSNPLHEDRLVDIVCYCLMPTHPHFILKQLKEDGISIFMRNLLNSYSRYYNTKYKRKGPLWEGRFEDIRVQTDEQLLHLTRYIHLNPVTARLVEKPEDWRESSYNEYLGRIAEDKRICNYASLLQVDPRSYKDFVEERIDYQRELARIKGLLLDIQPTRSKKRGSYDDYA